MTEMSTIKLIGATVTSLILGGFLIYASMVIWVKNINKKDWPKVSAVVVSSDLSHGPIPNSGSNVRLKGFQWKLTVEYKFYLEGREYRGDRVSNISEDWTHNVGDDYTFQCGASF